MTKVTIRVFEPEPERKTTMTAHVADMARQISALEKEILGPDEFRHQDEGLRAEFAAIMADSSRVFQASKKVLPPPDYETPAQYRARLLKSLASTTYLRYSDINSVIKNSGGLDAAEKYVHGVAMKAAHEAPDLRTITTEDRSGRKIFEFVGQKSSWMRPLQGPAFVSAIYEDGVPQRIPYLPT